MEERLKILYLFDVSFLGFKCTFNVKNVNKRQPEENAGSIMAFSNFRRDVSVALVCLYMRYF